MTRKVTGRSQAETADHEFVFVVSVELESTGQLLAVRALFATAAQRTARNNQNCTTHTKPRDHPGSQNDKERDITSTSKFATSMSFSSSMGARHKGQAPTLRPARSWFRTAKTLQEDNTRG